MPPSVPPPLRFFSSPLARIRQVLLRFQAPSHQSMTGSSPRVNPAKLPKSYPQTRRTDHVDTYVNKEGEVKVPDPYNWAEQDTEERSAWLDSAFCVQDRRRPLICPHHRTRGTHSALYRKFRFPGENQSRAHQKLGL